ncbi:AAA family ATPase [Candidatus Clostridium helianthi]|uniref:DUF3696 domain-containing protein n=1 Tax=Candidatus Clostridium helianthi TaxID=3381660 RepID=A0ABW8S4E4_9CLOT
MITNIKISGFKCFDNCLLNINNLNLFTGMNSSGKSSAIQAILLTYQSVRNDKNTNLLNGEYIKLGKFNDIKNYITGSKNIDLEITFDNSKNAKIQLFINEENEMCIDIEEDSKEILDNEDLIYISADRTGVQDVYNINTVDNERIGIHCEYAFGYLSKNGISTGLDEDFVKDIDYGKSLGNQVDYWLEYILGYSIQAEEIVDTDFIKVMYRKSSSAKMFRPRHVGTGVSYVASIIIATLSCKKDSIIIIENPEIHLHPAAQSKLIEFFAFLASKGIQVIIETHSDHIFNGMRKSIKRGEITPENSQVYFFKQDEKGICNPVNIEINKTGAIGNQQNGLFDQFDDDLDELLGL